MLLECGVQLNGDEAQARTRAVHTFVGICLCSLFDLSLRLAWSRGPRTCGLIGSTDLHARETFRACVTAQLGPARDKN